MTTSRLRELIRLGVPAPFPHPEGGGKSPAAPNYAGAAEAQGQSAKENTAQQTWANRPAQYTPWGKTTWDTARTWDAGTDTPVTSWTQREELNPQLQSALDDQINIQAGRSGAANTLLGQATSAFANPMDFSQLPQAGTLQGVGYNADFSKPTYQPGTVGKTDFDAGSARNRAEQALYERQMNRIEPQLTQSEAARRTRLANMGISPEGGSEAWNRAQTSMGQTRNQAVSDAALAAIAGGGAEATREMGMAQGEQAMNIGREQANLGLATGAQGLEAQRLGMATSATDTMNRQRQQAIAEMAYKRGMPLNELNALLTGQQVSSPNMPNFSNAGAAAATPYLDAAKAQGDFDQKSAASAGSGMNSLLNTAGQLGGAYMGYAALAASDRRLKRNVVPLGRGWYAFNYLWDNILHFGVMAQEVLRTRPEAVIVGPGGWLMVNYAKL